MTEFEIELKRVRGLAEQQTIEVSEWRFDDLASSRLTTSPTTEAFDQEGN